MEELTKQQMVLLTLLVSFVSSIATSVSVVTLLNEEPMTITQTVNRIVEKTIEKVVPAEILPTPEPKPLPPVATIKESDLVVKAVEMNLPAVVTLWSWKTEKEESIELGIGFSVSADGIVVTDKDILGDAAEYSAIFPNGKIYKAKRVYTDKDSDIAILVLRNDKDQNATSTPFVSFSLDEPKLGASVTALGGKEGASVYQGIVSEKTKTHILTSIPFKQIDRGGVLFGIDGKVFGINITAGDEKYTLPSAAILFALEDYRKEGTPQTP